MAQIRRAATIGGSALDAAHFQDRSLQRCHLADNELRLDRALELDPLGRNPQTFGLDCQRKPVRRPPHRPGG